MSDLDRIRGILADNSSKGFVKRILDHKSAPRLKNPDGSVSTHSMAWGESGGRYFVFPTVLADGNGKLNRYGDNEAWRYTQESGNFIEFDSAEDADWFSRNYKRVWGE